MSGSRFDRELDELLASIGDWTPRETRGQRLRRRFRSWLLRWQESIASMRWTGIPTDQLMLGGFILIVVAYFLRLALPVMAAYVGLVGVLVFFVAFGLAVRGGRRRSASRWRGQPIDFYRRRGAVSFLVRLRLWWQRRTWR